MVQNFISLNLKPATFRARFLEMLRFIEDRSESQGSRFQDHRSYNKVGLPAHVYVGAAEKTCQRARERAIEREKESGGRRRWRTAN